MRKIVEKTYLLTELVCALGEELPVVSEGKHTGPAEARVDPTRGRGHGGDVEDGHHHGHEHRLV